MLNLLSILVGVIAFPVLLIGLIPFLGWLNYLVIALALIGIALGSLGENKTGRTLNIVVLVISFLRLALGHFII
jgi:hypothetical protein